VQKIYSRFFLQRRLFFPLYFSKNCFGHNSAADFSEICVRESSFSQNFDNTTDTGVPQNIFLFYNLYSPQLVENREKKEKHITQ